MTMKALLQRLACRFACKGERSFVAVMFGTLVIAFAAFASDVFAQRRTGHIARAVALIERGELVLAEAELRAALAERRDEAEAFNLLGVIRARQGRTREAEGFFRRAIELAPDAIGARINLGQLYMESHDWDRALLAFSEAARLASDNEEVDRNLAAIYAQRGDFSQAIAHLRKIPAANRTAPDLYLLVKSYLELADKDEALELARASLDRLPSDDAANLATLFAARGLLDDAISLLEAAQRRDPRSFAVHYNLATAYYQKKDLARAEEHYMAALAIKPEDVATLRALARVANARGEWEKALSHLARARKLAPTSTEILYEFGVAALRLNLFLDALPIFEQLQKLRPNEPPYIYMLAAAYLQKGDRPQAETLMRRYIALRPNDPAGYYQLGLALYGLNRFAEARQALERSLSLREHPETEFLLGLVAENEGSLDEAIQRMERVLALAPEHAAAQATLGIALAKRGDYERARLALERAIALDPRNRRAHYQLGLVYARLGDKGRARQMIEIAEKLRVEERDRERVIFKLVEPPTEER
jgi:tetratricopeptide (TPR) repeat protein